MKFGAYAHFAFYPDAAAMRFDQMFGNESFEARAAGFARTRHIHAVKALEDSRLIRLRDADAGVCNREDHFIAAGFRA